MSERMSEPVSTLGLWGACTRNNAEAGRRDAAANPSSMMTLVEDSRGTGVSH